MISITIDESVRDETEMVDLLNEIARQVERGFTSGFYPHWTLVGEVETNTEEDDASQRIDTPATGV